MHITIVSLVGMLAAMPFIVRHLNETSGLPSGMARASIENVSSLPKGMKTRVAPKATTSREGVLRTTSNEGMLTSR